MTTLAAGPLELFNYWVYVGLMMIGLYTVMAKTNLLKKIMGLSLFQTGIFIFYISMGVVDGSTPPYAWSDEDRVRHALPRMSVVPERAAAARTALDEGSGALAAREALGELSAADQATLDEALTRPYASPLPHVLILTAIVVSVSTMAVALAIVIEIRRTYGTVEADELVLAELEAGRIERS